MSSAKNRMVVGISGATGIIYGIYLLQLLRELGIETHLVVTKAAQLTRSYETTLSLSDLKKLADVYYSINDLGASIASGSFKTMGMIIAPCSVNTLSAVATGISDNLLVRAADVVLKERRRLVLLLREFPLHNGHLKNMLAVTEMGGIIAPPVPAFYTKPKTIEDIIIQTLGRTLDLFGLDIGKFQRWEGLEHLSKKTGTPTGAGT